MSFPDQATAPGEKRQSIRIVLEGLILASIIWMAKSTQEQVTNIAKLQVQMESVSSSLANVPNLTERVTKVEMSIVDLERRQTLDDAHREQSGLPPQNFQPNLKRWTR